MNGKTCSIAVALGLFALSSTAMAAGKGTSILALELGQGTVTVSETVNSTVTPNYISLNQGPEANFGAEFFTYLSDDFGLCFSGAFGTGSYKEEPNDATTDPVNKITTSSYRARVGVDRLGSVGDRLTVFGGPGLEFVSAKAKFTSSPSTPAVEEESSRAKAFGLSGRIGLMMKLGESVSIVGRFGNSLALVSSKAAAGNAKSSALTNSFDAAWGIAFSFGGK